MEILNKINKKILFLTIFTIAFQSLCYLIGKLGLERSVLLDPKIDQIIPFISPFIFAYIAWYPLLIILPMVIYYYDKKSYYYYFSSVIITSILGITLFLIIPITITRYTGELSGISSSFVKLIYFIDTPTSCLPSFHAAICFIWIFLSLKSKKMPTLFKVLVIVISILIILSTLFIKQHILLDVIAAFFVVLIAYNLSILFKLDKKVEFLLNYLETI